MRRNIYKMNYIKSSLLIFSILANSSLIGQTFTELTNTPFEGVGKGAMKFADIDGDGDSDLVITGDIGQLTPSSLLYLNDGQGNFELSVTNFFNDVYSGSMDIADIDNDGDEDLFITGFNNTPDYVAALYRNNGNGIFTEEFNHPIEGIIHGSVKFFDADNDDDFDLIVTGQEDSSFSPFSQLYFNDGNGNFSKDTMSSFLPVRNSWVDYSDVNGDKFLDILITGRDSQQVKTANLYLNNGTGIFIEDQNSFFDGVWQGNTKFEDIDNDSDYDVLITGRNNDDTRIAKLYVNDGNGNFTENSNAELEGVFTGSVEFADLNNDLSPDLLITGKNNDNQRISHFYLNDGNGNFSLVDNNPFDAVESSFIAIEDVNEDNLLDILVTGWTGSPFIAKLFINDGISSTSELSDSDNTPFSLFPNPTSQPIIFIKLDDDNKEDLEINIIDHQGKLLTHYNYQKSNGLISIDISNFAKGAYAVQIKNANGVSCKQFIKN